MLKTLKKPLLVTTFVIALLGATVYLISTFGLNPKAIPVIKLSAFDDPKVLGKALAERLRETIKANSLIILGVLPNEEHHHLAWQAFLENLTEPEYHYDIIVTDQELFKFPENFAQEKISFKDNLEVIATGINTALSSGKRIAIIAPSAYTSQILTLNTVSELKKKFQLQPLSLSMVTFPRNLEEEKAMPIPCLTTQDINGSGPLGCIIQLKGKIVARKSPDPKKFVGLMDQYGAKDYLIFFNKPKE
jgi:hypothetical protein